MKLVADFAFDYNALSVNKRNRIRGSKASDAVYYFASYFVVEVP